MPKLLFEVVRLRVAIAHDRWRHKGDVGPVTEDGGQLAPGWVEVLGGASYGVHEGEVLGLVGESASGKSLMLMGSFGLLSSDARLIGPGEANLPRSGRLLRAFRHELSRGMTQLAMLAAALIKTPHMLIAVELLNGLDPSVAAGIMDLRTNGTWQCRSSLTTSPRWLVSRIASQSCTAARSSSMHRSRIYAASRTTHTRLGWSARFPV